MPLSSVLGAQSLVRPGVCTSSTRPASPFEGQVIYETDTDLVQVYNGSGWKSLGRMVASTNGAVLQVVSTTKTDTFTTTSTTFGDITGLTATITPTSTSSKIFVIASTVGGGTSGSTALWLRLARGGTAIAVGDAAGNRVSATGIVFTNADQPQSPTVHALDSPNTTSAVTYSLQARVGTGGTAYINRTVTDPNQVNDSGRFASSITVMEIAG